MFLVVEEEDSPCSYLNPLLLFISKAHGILWSYTRNFTIKTTLKKRFAKASNKKT